jgi:NTP pyrophosphatase (non-canonical NTP hydrolase)
MDLKHYQHLIKKLYYKKDSQRGLDKTYTWFIEEIGELARAIRKGDPEDIKEEFADCLAWLLSIGTILGIDAEEAMDKYAKGCPKCGKTPCECKERTGES